MGTPIMPAGVPDGKKKSEHKLFSREVSQRFRDNKHQEHSKKSALFWGSDIVCIRMPFCGTDQWTYYTLWSFNIAMENPQINGGF